MLARPLGLGTRSGADAEQRGPGARALARADSGRNADGGTLHSFCSLPAELGTLTKNTIRLPGSEGTFDKLSLPTRFQAEVLPLLGLSPSL